MSDKFLTIKDRLPEVLETLKALPGMSVLVGIPADNTERTDEGITNAAIGYIMEFGSPVRNIPARPHLIPGIRGAKDKINNYLKQAAQFAMQGEKIKMHKALMAAGQSAVTKVQSLITEGIPPPLADSTLRARARRKAGRGHRINKGAAAELASRAAGNDAGLEFMTPLIDTGNYYRAITYVIREGV